jgi:hypothetical protein
MELLNEIFPEMVYKYSEKGNAARKLAADGRRVGHLNFSVMTIFQ